MSEDTDTGGCLGCIVLVALIFILIAIVLLGAKLVKELWIWL